MPNLITKITTKIILAFAAGTFFLSAVFLITDYTTGMSRAEDTGREKLRAVSTALASAPEFLMHADRLQADTTGIEERITTSASRYLARFAAHGDTDIDASILFIDTNGAPMHFSTARGTAHPDEKPEMIAAYSAQKEHAGFLTLPDQESTDLLHYAAPAEVHGGRISRAVLFATTDVSEIKAAAFNRFFGELIGTLVILTLLVVFGKKRLSRILSHETLAKKKLDEYATAAAKRNSELETLSFVLGKSANLIVLTDKDGKIEWLNESTTRKNNYSVEELDSFKGRELAEVSQYPRIKEVLAEVKRSGRKLEYEAKSYDSERNEFWAATTVTPVKNCHGEIDKILFIDADITKLKRAEAEIEKLADMTRENTGPVIRIALDRTVTYANPAGQKILTQWNIRTGDKVSASSVVSTLSACFKSGDEKSINIASEKRIFNLRFIPLPEKGYANVYGEDITEAKTASRAGMERAARMEKHNLNITDSINYARRIQESILPGEDQIRKYFRDSFAMMIPKDIVSGDFLWVHELVPERAYLLALADCTGHGVPGAMMSIIGHSLLNEIVETHGFTEPARVLKLLNTEVIKTLRQKNGSGSSDGMDIALVHIDLVKMKIRFSGAYRPVLRMNGSLHVFNGDRQPIGGMHHKGEREFHVSEFDIAKGDSIYLMSDGLSDQFGGPENKKFLTHRVKDMIAKNHKYSMQAQSYVFRETFNSWKGECEQIDDVSVIGIKF